MSQTTERIRLSITGKVQGVGFRNFTVTKAKQIGGITGWVKNEPDGSVTVVAEGNTSNLQQLIQALHGGPTFARVDEVHKKRKPATGEFSTFQVRY